LENKKKVMIWILLFSAIFAMVMGLATGTKVLVGMTLHMYLIEEIFHRSGILIRESSLG
jgi:hypothetical protein